MLEEAREAFELGHRRHQLLQVLEPAGRVGRAVLLPHLRVAAFVEHDGGELGMRLFLGLVAPALERDEEIAERAARGGLQLVGAEQARRRFRQGQALGARKRVQRLHRLRADAAARHVDDALECQIVGRLMDEAEIGHGVADFLALVKARAADDAIGQAEREEPFLELARLEAGAHQDRDLAQRFAVPLQRLDLLADPARFLDAVAQARAARRARPRRPGSTASCRGALRSWR